jgi:hypothetical protein
MLYDKFRSDRDEPLSKATPTTHQGMLERKRNRTRADIQEASKKNRI